MISIIISLIVAVLFGLWGYGKKLFPVWAFAFNVIIAVYLGVMLTPSILEPAGEMLKSLGTYTNVTVMLAVAIIYFVIAQFLSTNYLTGTYCVSFNKAANNAGGLILGFAGGFLIANFVLFVIAASPLKEISWVEKCIPADMEKTSGKQIVKACKFVSGFSLQYGDKSISKAIETISRRSLVQIPPKTITPQANQPKPALEQPQNTVPDSNG
jgi:hypothetical protein